MTWSWPALDGLRALAVLAVIAYHCGLLPAGYLGVDVFFVLSGFLITALLRREWESRGGRISFRDFYARRMLRLFPSLGCVVVASVVLAAMIEMAGGVDEQRFAHATITALPWVGTFASNWAIAFNLSSLGSLAQTWSLAIEEQFYILWPALFVLLMRRGYSRDGMARVLTCAAVAEMVYRAAAPNLGFSHAHVHFGLDTHSSGLLVGCALAFWLTPTQPIGRPHGRATLVTAAAWAGLALLVAEFALGGATDTAAEEVSTLLATGVIVTALVAGASAGVLGRIFVSKPAVYVGRRSYGLYLWHYVIFSVVAALQAPYTGVLPANAGLNDLTSAVVLGAEVTLSFVLAELSYRFIELPALRLKRRFQPPVSPCSSAVGTAPCDQTRQRAGRRISGRPILTGRRAGPAIR
jgi:peptidoglycan/LPS O-acetylase OafA/YrhL